VSFFFARKVQKGINVPIGIIVGAWGGRPVQGFMPYELLVQLGEVNDTRFDHATEYNCLIYPVRRYTLKGFLYYQGCANVGQEENWLRLMAAMVQHWRELWGLGTLPFYYCLIAPFEYGANGLEGALMREAQRRLQFLIPNSGAVNTIDLVFPYERHNQHPAEKDKIGQRFGLLALKYVYGFSGLFADSPSYEFSEIKGKSIWCYVSLPNNGLALFKPDTEIIGLEIANESGIFVPAIGSLGYGRRGRPVLIASSPEIEKPVAVRYCFRDFQIGNVFNRRGLPLFAFRTDNWAIPPPPADFWEEVISKLPVPYDNEVVEAEREESGVEAKIN
jgi:sialate O-acetylesterase